MSEQPYAERLIAEARRAASLVESDARDWMPDPRAHMQMNLTCATYALAEELQTERERVRQMKEALQAYRDVVVIAADMEGAMAHDHEQPPGFMKQAMSEALTEAERHDTKVKGWLEVGDSTEAPPHPEAKLGSTDA